MIYTSNLNILTEYLSGFIMEAIGKTAISRPLFEEIQQVMKETLKNGVEAFCEGASASGLCYGIAITVDDVDTPIVFEQWRVSDIRLEIHLCGYTKEDLPTLFRISNEQLRELLEHMAFKEYSLYCEGTGLLINLIEEIAQNYFANEP